MIFIERGPDFWCYFHVSTHFFFLHFYHDETYSRAEAATLCIFFILETDVPLCSNDLMFQFSIVLFLLNLFHLHEPPYLVDFLISCFQSCSHTSIACCRSYGHSQFRLQAPLKAFDVGIKGLLCFLNL